ncbi:MAG: tetratricopeptide repeat protein [Halothermotrichaceae bacterium]
MSKMFGTFIGFMGYMIQVITKKPELAVKIYKFADKFDNRSSFSAAAHGNYLFNHGKLEEALVKFKKMRKVSKKNYLKDIAGKNMALCYWRMNRLDDSIRVMEEIKNKYDYRDESILTTLGYFYFLNGNYEKAINSSEEALKEKPEHGPALDNLGQIYFKKGEYEKAEEYFLKALEYRDNLIDSKYFLGLIYEKWGDKGKAAEYFRKASLTNLTTFSTVTKEELDDKCSKYNIL